MDTQETEQKANLLIVDDEPRIVRTLERLLRPHFTTHTATSGAEALKLLRRHRIHVILSDQRMPEMTGVELLEKARQISPNSTRVLLTGYSDLAAVVDSVNKGEIFRYITKPWKNDELIEVVKQAADISRGLYRAAVRNRQPSSQKPAPREEKTPTVLILDEKGELKQVVEKLVGNRSRVVPVRDLQQAREYLASNEVEILVTRPDPKAREEFEFIKRSKAEHPQLLSILIAEKADSKRLIEMINEGQIYRFLFKPFTMGQLKIFLMSALRYQKKLRENPEQARRHMVQQVAREETPEKPQRPSLLRRILALFRRFHRPALL